VAVVIDHYSRRVVGFATFGQNPTTLTIQSFLESAIFNAGAAPKYIICDKGQQFWCDAFKAWCDRLGITPRFGAVGQHGSIALVERFILSLKNQCTRVILVPLRSEAFRRELVGYADWFNQDRPHSALGGKTPHEVYHHSLPANERPRYEPRAKWPHSAPCSAPHAPVAGNRGSPIRLDVRYDGARKHLPIVDLRLAA
jgi:transposase InsO family protein